MKYFKAYELVDKQVYDKFGEDSIQRFFDPRLLKVILFIRDSLGKPITINTWHEGGRFSQRGLRTNMSPIVMIKHKLYLSGHVLGMAIDFDVKGMTAEEVRLWIIKHQKELPYPIRLESKVNWVHLGVDTFKNGIKIDIFNI
jgi:hypothetical protein